jgi:hypothetical protein
MAEILSFLREVDEVTVLLGGSSASLDGWFLVLQDGVVDFIFEG